MSETPKYDQLAIQVRLDQIGINGLLVEYENLERELASLTSERDKLRLNQQWHAELLEAIYEEMPDGMNERPDPRQLVREWRRAHGKLAEAKAEVERLKARANGLFEENATLAGECVNLARAPQVLTQRLAKWREVAEHLHKVSDRVVLRSDDSLWVEHQAALAAFERLQKEEPKP